MNAQPREPQRIGERIDALLKELGQTASWLADRANVERSTVSRILRHERQPNPRTLQSIAGVLELTVAQLVEGTDAVDQADDPGDVISREHYNQAVREVIEYERKATDLSVRVREFEAELKDERERRRSVESRLELAEREREEARRAATRYADALDLAITDITLLRTQVDRLLVEAREGKRAGQVLTGLAGIAAAASVATYLTRATVRAEQPKARRSKTTK